MTRIQDVAKQSGQPLYLALLDWEKGFDKIVHDKFVLALERIGCSERVINAIRNAGAGTFHDSVFLKVPGNPKNLKNAINMNSLKTLKIPKI